jgi:predicted Zn-dependent peptidase
VQKHAGTNIGLTTKQTEQAHLVFGVEGVSALSDDHFAQKLLAVILGGSMSSRMFLRIREARGLCYYISTSTDNYLDTGLLSTRAGVDQSRLHEAISAIRHEYEVAAKDGFDAKELQRAKDFLKGKITLSMEDSEERAHFFGKQQLLYPAVKDLPEYFKAVDSVSLDQINRLGKKLLQKEQFRLVVIGKEKEEKRLEELIIG